MVITDLGVLEPDPDTAELTLVRVHPGVEPDEVHQATGWDLAVADQVAVTAAPSERELEVLRGLERSSAGAS